ncbi:MAG: MmcQ/YjbR family DNA-binding protein [Verrucomicrobiota bacterium]
MPATLADVRRIALSLPETREAPCYGRPGFYVQKKIFACLREDGETLAVTYPKTERDELIDRHPDVFFYTDHYVKYDWVVLNLFAISSDLLRDTLADAWRLRAGKKLVAASLTPPQIKKASSKKNP